MCHGAGLKKACHDLLGMDEVLTDLCGKVSILFRRYSCKRKFSKVLPPVNVNAAETADVSKKIEVESHDSNGRLSFFPCILNTTAELGSAQAASGARREHKITDRPG